MPQRPARTQPILSLEKIWIALISFLALRSLHAFFLGILAGGGFAPYRFWWLYAAAWIGLLFRIHHSPVKEVGLLVFFWGMGLFISSFYWVSFALAVDLVKFAWLLPFSVVGIPALLSMVQALPFFFLSPLFSSPLLLASGSSFCLMLG